MRRARRFSPLSIAFAVSFALSCDSSETIAALELLETELAEAKVGSSTPPW